MKKLFIVNLNQFGYHTDTYYYCKYLKNYYDITIICWDYGLPIIEMTNVRVFYISRDGNSIIRMIRFILHAFKKINDNNSIVFVKYFKGISLLSVMVKPKHIFVLDIRTGSIHSQQMIRIFENIALKIETQFFKNVTVISQSLSKKLGIAKKAHVLPIGADVISSIQKSFNSLNLIYVGTLSNRKIHITIHGFKKFNEDFKNRVKLSYTIIGDGPNNEVMILKKLVSYYGLEEQVKVTGTIPHNQLKSYFDAANIGVSYVPLTAYYDCQPVTKTFEYLLSGMPVIATLTSENKKVIDAKNGVLIGDTSDEFKNGLKQIYKYRNQFDSVKIRNQSMRFNWKNVVDKNLKVYLENLYTKRCPNTSTRKKNPFSS